MSHEKLLPVRKSKSIFQFISNSIQNIVYCKFQHRCTSHHDQFESGFWLLFFICYEISLRIFSHLIVSIADLTKKLVQLKRCSKHDIFLFSQQADRVCATELWGEATFRNRISANKILQEKPRSAFTSSVVYILL